MQFKKIKRGVIRPAQRADIETVSIEAITAPLSCVRVRYASVLHEQRVTKMNTHYSRTDRLHLKGEWLKEAGFATDTRVIVAMEQVQLVIRPAE
ncbi:SymE family type I addiction module toxin [Rahnella sp. Larv3_ips]|uniref:SymE family type I addiction module toxin n=1 Tax=Rahnella sp. Larv3_ips TaxID=1896943 RepID=UPI000EFAE7F7|nr:SymE family type I addiction module toxin [Rahnella sp. Larv3_ips]